MKAMRTILSLTLLAVLSLSFAERSEAKVYASHVRFTQEASTAPFDGSFADRSGMAIRFILNHQADSVVINVVPAAGGPAVKTLRKSNVPGGDNVIIWNGSNNSNTPAAAAAYKAQVIAYHRGFATYTEYHLSTPAIFTRGVGSVNNPALRWFGFIYSASNGGYVVGVARHASSGQQWGNVPDSAFLTSTGVPVGPSDVRYATLPDQDGYVYLIGLTARRIYRYHLDTMNVALFDSSAYGMRIQSLDVRGVGVNKILYVTGDSTIFRIPIGTQNFNTIVPTALARVTPGKRMVFWDAEVGQDNSLYVVYRADSALTPFPAPSRGLLKFNLSTGVLPKTLADTVWSSRIPDGDPVTLAIDDGPTQGGADDILYMNSDLGAPNTFSSGIYAYTNLTATSPTRSVAWADPDNNCSSARSAVATDVLGNVIYFENSNEQVVLVSPPSGPNSYTYTSFSQVSVTASGIAPILYSLADARIDADGNRRPDRLGDTVKVIGIVNSVNVQTTNFNYFIQDATDGIAIFQFGLLGAPTLRPGDRISVIGAVGYNRGTTQIQPANLATDISVLDTGNAVTSVPLTITQYMAAPERYESRRITLAVAQPFNFTSTQWPATGSSANLTIWNGQDTTVLRIDSDTEIDGSPYPTWPVRLTGVGTQFTSATTNDTTGYQITPMFISDFVPINAPPISNFRLLTPANGSSIVIDTTANYNFTWRRSVDFNNDPITYQFKPVTSAGVLSNNAGADSVITRTGAQMMAYLGANDVLDFRWTVLAKDTPNPVVSSRDTFSVILRRFPPPTPGWTARTSGTTAFLQSVKQVNASVIWAAGNGAVVRKSTDGGATWTNANPTPGVITGDIYNIEALDANTALVTTSPAATFIYRTTNGGTTWTQVYTQAGGFINAIRMFSATNGIAEGDPVGTTFTIVTTTDGGATWVRNATANEPVPVGGEFGLNNSLSTVGTTHVWFGSSVGPVWRSTNGGTVWTRATTTFTGNNLEVHFNNTTNGVTGNSAGLAARSTDGGATWVATTIAGTGGVNGLSGMGNDFFASKGTNVYRSTDRGATWAVSFTGAIGTLSHLDFFGNVGGLYGTTVSQTGGIATAYFAATGVEENTLEVPTTFALSQNYPNPFNPSTSIRYSLPKDAFVSLKIYNVVGQEIATLKEEFQNVGTFTIVWNGRNSYGQQVASGMYLYRIEARPADGGQPFTSLKKMVLLK